MLSHQALLDDFPFNQMIEVLTVGNAGGLFVLWDDNMLELDEIATTVQEIHVMIKVSGTIDSWLFSSIYATSLWNMRKILWENLHTIKNNYSGKWLIGGNFNELLHSLDKKGGNPLNTPCSKDFWDIINYYEFIDQR
ncbi:hypothetical protein R3W88_029849 [Solanum pinnatisectum]|uniref:Endonuclease/exonuclease/phosphatase domain-containing protein n=1 Tax=Solanum pinnatisectum TaxID=50273 RepID=A0AAV9K6R2_9SOLN|nr:hypothetical protein R3W88_029849 [Solanum pinnatisectum]